MFSRLPSLLYVLAVCASLFSLPATLFAQDQTGTIEGHVLDAGGAAIANATVTATSSAVQGGSKTAQSDAEGYYRLSQLPVGSYDLSVALSGFATEAFKDVRVHAATTFTVNATMTV